jgi:hypothetical protein
MSARVIAPNSFPGLKPRPQAQVETDPAVFAQGSGQQEIQALQREGFVSGIGQLFNPARKSVRAGGVSTAIQLGSPAQAKTELSRYVKFVLKSGHWDRFKVKAIRGSRGFETVDAHQGVSNLGFVDGSYFYGIGTSQPGNNSHAKQVISAATRLYRRVHGSTTCP